MRLCRYRVAASCFEPDPAQSREQRREALRAHLVQLFEEQRPDLVVLPELVLIPDFREQPDCGAEALEGPTVCLVAALARKYRANVCAPIVEAEGERRHNTAVYVDREGRVAGKYRKSVLTGGELDAGLQPGEGGQGPAELDGLRIGTAICFDHNFPDLLWPWIEAGVDLLVYPAYTYGGTLMRQWAITAGVPLVCAFPWESALYDRDGSLLAVGGTKTDTVRFGHHRPWIAWTLNLQSRVYHLDFNQEKLPELAARYGGKVEVRLSVRDARFLLSAVAEEVDLDVVEQELGLVPLQDYLRASRRRNDEARPG